MARRQSKDFAIRRCPKRARGTSVDAAGGSATVQGVFASCIYTSKKVFNFGLMFDATPDITVAATGDSTGQDSACVGLKWMCGSALAGITSLGVKTTTAALSLVAVKKFGKDATLAVSASSRAR